MKLLMDCPHVSYLQAPLQLPQIQEPEKMWREWVKEGTRIKIHLEPQSWAPFDRWHAADWQWILLEMHASMMVESISANKGVVDVTGKLTSGIAAGQIFGAVAGILERTSYAQEIRRIRIEAS